MARSSGESRAPVYKYFHVHGDEQQRWTSSGQGSTAEAAQFRYEDRIIFQSEPRLYNGHRHPRAE